MTIYLVIGETGAYEDWCEWVSKAFTSKKLATQFMQKCTDFVATAPCNAKGRMQYFDNEWRQNSPDPEFACDYTGTSYEIREVELVTDKFMETLLTTKD